MTPPGGLEHPGNLYEQIIQSLSSGVIVVNGEGQVVEYNRAACGHLGIEEDGLRLGAPLEQAPAAAPFASALHEVRERGNAVVRQEVAIQTANGSKTLGVTLSLLEGDEEFNGAIFLFADLTEARALERMAQVNRQLAEIGELTSGVVHEFRNPLGVISGMAELLMRGLEEDKKLCERARTIYHETEHLDRLVSEFLSFAKPFETKASPTQARDIVDRAMQLCRHLAEKRGVLVELDVPGGLPTIETDLNMVAQALANLIRNAIEVLEPGQSAAVRVSHNKDSMVFRVEDTGPGISLAPGEDLFSPFFTKKVGGTGLGLSIVHRIITAHGGTATYGNREEGGAYFEIHLPLHSLRRPRG